MKKLLLLSLMLSCYSTSAFSEATCYGVPSFLKMGEYGAQESYIIVRVRDRDYRLGLATDEAAKIRMSIAHSALLAEKEVKMRFYDATNCDEASNNRTVPNSFQLVK